MPQEDQGGPGERPDLGGMVVELLAYWTFGGDPHAAGETTGHGYGPVRLVVWTVAAIGVAAAVSAVRIALFGEPTAGWGIALLPLLLPLTGAVAHRPPGYVPALVSGVAAGLVAALLLGIDLGTTLSSFWAGFGAVSAGFLVCSVVFAVVTRAAPAPPRS
uniref:hypothetical protein n=1 Tax=Nonomuraea pusilla TaxID=46177 RepID=UPI0006E2510B|nr:hypothetical protein [Nonomuraea pusilla]